ncbi:MAG: peptide-methionine (R)-S-oxide reductase MsrB [Bacteroidota bacterium]
MTDADWKARLAPEQYRILREKGTERAFTGAYVHTDADGMYRCAGCGAELFASSEKFESGSGWPSFADVVSPDAVVLHDDFSHGMHRIEVSCAVCGGHLGHVFDDGLVESTGLRYCINSGALDFEGGEAATEE